MLLSVHTRYKVLRRDSEGMQKRQQSWKDVDISFIDFKVKRDLVTCLAPFHITQATEGCQSFLPQNAALKEGSLFPKLWFI